MSAVEENRGVTWSIKPLGTRVVNQMLQVVQARSNILKHEIYFHNFFTSYDLLSSLGEQNIRAVGAIREKRKAVACKSIQDV